MQNKTYSDLLGLIKALSGVNNFTQEEEAYILSFVNRRAQQAYDTSDSWDRYIRVSEERNVSSLTLRGVTAGDTSVNGNYIFAGKSSSSGDAVLNSNVYYQADASVTSSTITGPLIYKRDAVTDVWVIAGGSGTATINADKTITVTGNGTTYFTQNDGVDSDTPVGINIWSVANAVIANGTPEVEDVVLIPYTQSGKSNIGHFLKIHRNKAYLSNSVRDYDFFVDANGANILNIANGTDLSVYVTYKEELPDFTTVSTDIPREFFNYLAHSVYSDFLKMDGQNEKSITEESIANNYLNIELDKIEYSSNVNQVLSKFSTYVSRQAR